MNRSLRLVCTVTALLICSAVFSQTSLPLNTIVTENFNSIGAAAAAALPANWKMSASGAGAAANWTTVSNITATTQAASGGTPAAGGAYNWATTAGTDRAIGFMTDGGYASPNAILAFYRNTTGATVTSITVAFTVERYRINTSAFSLSFFSSTDGNTWTSRAAGDISPGAFATGASSYTFTSPQTFIRTVVISGLSIPNNGDFYLRWIFTTGGTTTSQGLGLDNVSLFAGTPTPVLTSKLRDAITVDGGVIGEANEGDQLTYTNVIKNRGTGDATGVLLTDPAPLNTTLVPGSIRTSALARDENYNTPVNTQLTGQNVLTNDFGLPPPTVLTFGPSKTPGATAAGGTGASDNGGTVVVNSNGTFTYTPPTGFAGTDQFAYIAGTGTLPNNDGIVTITVGSAASAVADNFNVIGNVSIAPTNVQGVLANDVGGAANIVTAVNGNTALVGVATTTTNGGNLTVNANGSFTYNPPAGFEGADNFNYTVDNGFSSPSVATVTLTVSGMIWFITNGGAAGDGRLSTPFNSIAAFQALNNGTGNNPAINDNIFIHENATVYTGSVTLLNGQKLIGQDATASLATITGLTPAAYSTALPVMNSGAPVTTLTTIVAATNAVNLNSAAGTNLLRGFTIGNTTGSGISGSGFGTLTISQVSKNGTGQALALTNGALAAGATLDNVTTTSSVNAISLTTITGNLSIASGTVSGATGTALIISGGTMGLTYSGNITQANNAALFSIGGGHTTGTILFQTGTLSATSGTGLQFDNADGIYGFNGTVTLNGGDAGIDILNGSGGTFNFAVVTGTISITSPTGTAFNVVGPTGTITYDGNITQANNAAMVSVSGGHTGMINFNAGNTLSATNGIGLQFDNADGSYNFSGTTTLNGGDAGIDILNGSAGTFFFVSTTSITSPTGIAFNISGTASTCGVTYHGNITHATNTAMINVVGGHNTGTLLFQTGTLSATNGTGLQFDNADGTYNFAGTTTLNGGDAGIDILNGSGGTFNFATATGSIAITGPTGTAFNIGGTSNTCAVTYDGNITKNNAGSLISIANHTTGTITFPAGNTLSATTATAGNGLQFSDADGSYQFLGTTTLNGGDAGIDILAGSAGTFNFQSGTTITNPSGSVVNIDNSPGGNFSYFGTFTKASTGVGIQVNNKTGGTVLFNTATKTLNTSASTAVNLTNNTGATITFGGNNLLLTTTTGIGFNATGGGTINVNGTGNTISSTTGTALNVVSTTIGASGLTFQSISANGGTNGIVLNNTGTNGGLNVTGTGTTAGSGGTIQATTGIGVSLTSTLSVSLSNLNVSGTLNHGIFGNSVNGFTLTGCQITNSGNADNEYGMNLINCTGTLGVNSTIFNNAADNLVYITSTAGTLNANFQNSSQFQYPAVISGTANSAILIEPGNAAVINTTIQNCTFTDIVSASAQFGYNVIASNGTSSFNFSNNTINRILAGRSGGVVFSGQENSTNNITINTNNFSGVGGNGVISIDVNDNSAVIGTASNNTIANAPGIGMFLAVDEDGQADITMNANTITNCGGDGIQTVNFGGVGVSTMRCLITNNNINGHSLNTAVSFVGGISFTGFEDNSCIAIRGNTVTGTPASPTQCGGAPCVDYYIEEVGGIAKVEEIPNTASVTANAAYINSINDPGPVTIFGIIDLTNGVLCNSNGSRMIVQGRSPSNLNRAELLKKLKENRARHIPE